MLRQYRRCEMECTRQKHENECGDSLSTDGSSPPRYQNVRRPKIGNKEKLQLCKKFTEFGYCPYQKRCKFAHGEHELRKNNSTNRKYKTKECVTFLEDGFCHYGKRCNFIHQQAEDFSKKDSILLAKANYRDIFYELTQESSLHKNLLNQ